MASPAAKIIEEPHVDQAAARRDAPYGPRFATLVEAILRQVRALELADGEVYSVLVPKLFPNTEALNSSFIDPGAESRCEDRPPLRSPAGTSDRDEHDGCVVRRQRILRSTAVFRC